MSALPGAAYIEFMNCDFSGAAYKRVFEPVAPTNESSKFVGDHGNIIPMQSGSHKTPKFLWFNIPGQAHELTFSCIT